MVDGRINEVVISTMFSDKKFTELLSGPKKWTKVRGGRVKVLSQGAVPLYLEDKFASYRVMKLRRSWGQFCISCSFTGTSHRFAL